MKSIRMLMFGPTKVGKTANVCTTFPGPVCLLNFDLDGWTSIRKNWKLYEPEKFLELLKTPTPIIQGEEEFVESLKVPQPTWLDDVHVVDFSSLADEIGALATRIMSAQTITVFIKIVNQLAKACPFKTVVVDPITMWDSSMNDFVGGMNSVNQLQIQHWGQAAKKKEEIITFINALPCHIVFIGHETTEKDEISGALRVTPLMTGQMKDKIGMMFSQYVYATTERNSKGELRYVLLTQPKDLIKGIGCRWPQNLPAVVDNNFDKMFGGQP